MTKVGLKEFRKNMSQFIARAQQGEKITVLNHSKIAFIIMPPTFAEPWQQLAPTHAMYETFATSTLNAIQCNLLQAFIIEKYESAKNIFRLRRGRRRLTIAVLDVEEMSWETPAAAPQTNH